MSYMSICRSLRRANLTFHLSCKLGYIDYVGIPIYLYESTQNTFLVNFSVKLMR